MNMQNKLYTVFSPPDDRVGVSPLAAIAERQTHRFHKIHKTPKKDRTPIKLQTPVKEKIQTQGNKKEKFLPLWPTPIRKLSMVSVVWNISIGQLGLAAELCSLPAPVHLLIS